MAGIKEDLWFKEGYNQVDPEDEDEDVYVDNQAFSVNELVYVWTNNCVSMRPWQ